MNFLNKVPSLFLLAAASCSTPVEKLKAEASSVSVLDFLTETQKSQLQKVGAGSCEIGANARTQKSNEISCKNYLRNEAAAKGATYIVFTGVTRKGITTSIVEAVFYRDKK